MTAPVLTVEIAFDGTTFIDVSAFCSGQIATNRGRSRETDQFATGTATFTLRNESRTFDPSNTAGTYYPNIVPGKPVEISLDGILIYSGEIDDITVSYQMPKTCTVDISCVDGFTRLAAAQLIGFTPGAQSCAARLGAVCAAVSFTNELDADTGASLQAGSFSNVAALDHIQTVARSENGFAFMDAKNHLRFYDHYRVSSEASQITFSDTGGAGQIPYAAIAQNSQALLLYNQVTGTRTGGTQQIANDLTSQAEYGIRTLALSSLENVNDLAVLELCQYIVSRYSQPDVRFGSVTVELSRFTSTVRESLAALELVELVTVLRTPPGSGSPTTLSKLSIIDGIAFALDASAATYRMTLNLGSVDTRRYFRLDDPIFGLLDAGNKIGF